MGDFNSLQKVTLVMANNLSIKGSQKFLRLEYIQVGKGVYYNVVTQMQGVALEPILCHFGLRPWFWLASLKTFM